jgi:uncharacterized protein YqeY
VPGYVRNVRRIPVERQIVFRSQAYRECLTAPIFLTVVNCVVTLGPMPLIDQISTDMTACMRSGEQARLDTLRMIKAALMKYKVDMMKPADDAAELQILTTLIKQRHEAADMFRKGNRPELADKEESELKIIESYMPAAPTDEEVDAAIAAAMAETGATTAKQMGLVMKAAQAKLAGKRVDGKAMSEKVRAKLA